MRCVFVQKGACDGVTVDIDVHVRQMNLPDSNLCGDILGAACAFTRIVCLSLQHNSIVGSIPASIGVDLPHLKYLVSSAPKAQTNSRAAHY